MNKSFQALPLYIDPTFPLRMTAYSQTSHTISSFEGAYYFQVGLVLL